jgi:adenylate kinase family enzyme
MIDELKRTQSIHIMGASGAGVTTLGRAVSRALNRTHLDTDDFFWAPTEPPFVSKRPVDERISLLNAAFSQASESGWVLSGALVGWGDALVSRFGLVVFVETPTELRIQRLRERESKRFGAAIAAEGLLYAKHEDFIAWSAGYEEGVYLRESHGFAIVTRNRASQEAWLAQLPCPVLRVDGARPVDALVDEVMNALGETITLPAQQG